MKKKLRKVICAAISTVMIMGIAIPVYADTTPFNITIPYDTLSPKTYKADDDIEIVWKKMDGFVIEFIHLLYKRL